METRTIETPTGQIGVVIHEGREFAAGGGDVTPTHATAYPGADHKLMLWDGKVIGTWRAVASWRINSWIGDRMYQIEAIIDGRTYTGRGLGEGMLWRGRIKASR